ncbi:condensation domain-containing protein, partial [Nitrosovibrio sp. Nv17]|uniref:condensation domain-containing protein n=1 Tax=Nitrosovibrio sp. Nv17 TaxID=1855339 RepID=UPI0009088C9E
VEALRWSFERIVERHGSLRSVFRAGAEGQGEQIVRGHQALAIDLVDLSGPGVQDAQGVQGVRSAEAAQAAWEEARIQAHALNAEPFDLERGPLIRIGLWRLEARRHLLVVVLHHIIADGWSMRIIVDEFVALYRERVTGEAARLSELPIDYGDYAAWQRSWLEAGEKERQLAWWRTHLGDEHPILELPTDRPRTALGRYRTARCTFDLPEALSAALRQLAQRHNGTVFMLLLAGFQGILYRYSGQQDIRIGVPVANRNRIETEGIVGFFVNTQVVRARVHGRLRLEALLSQAIEAVLGAQSHQDLPFDQLVEALQPQRSLSHPPLFQVMHNHQRTQTGGLDRLPGLTIIPYDLGEQGAQFELTLDTVEHDDGGVSACLTYAAQLFDAATIERLGRHYLRLLEALVRQPQALLGEVGLLDEAERSQLLAW